MALIHALAHSVDPINQALQSAWPQAIRMNLLDDSLSADLARSGAGLDAAMHQRFESLAAYAEGTGAQAILFTCSAFGACIEAVATRRPHMPVLKPNEAMVVEAVALSGPKGRIGLIASFAPTLASMPAEFPAGVELLTELADAAFTPASDRTREIFFVGWFEHDTNMVIACCDVGDNVVSVVCSKWNNQRREVIGRIILTGLTCIGLTPTVDFASIRQDTGVFTTECELDWHFAIDIKRGRVHIEVGVRPIVVTQLSAAVFTPAVDIFVDDDTTEEVTRVQVDDVAVR